MAEESWPSTNHNDRNVTEGEYEQTQDLPGDAGVHGDPTDAAVVTAGAGLQVLVKAGHSGVLHGFAWISGASDVPLAVASNASGSTRYDWVVLRLDRSTWDVRAAVLQGTPGSGSPSMTQDAGDTGVWEIPLALVTVPTGAASVSVTPWAQYLGSRIRPTNSNRPTPYPRLGEARYEPDTGRWQGWNGAGWVALYEDSGEVLLSGGASTWTANSDSVARLRNGWVGIRISVKRQGIDFSPNDSDGGSRILQVPASLRPSRWQYFLGRHSNGAFSEVEVRSDGDVWCGTPSQNVAPGRVLNLTVNYPL